MFKINNISKAYGKKVVLKDISFEADKGQAIGILGVNGSGKSTLLSEIAKKCSGSEEFKIGYVQQETPLFDALKPIDNIRMWTSLTKSQILEALEQPPLVNMGITDFLDTPVAKMSGGMKKRVSLATVLINQPDRLRMD